MNWDDLDANWREMRVELERLIADQQRKLETATADADRTQIETNIRQAKAGLRRVERDHRQYFGSAADEPPKSEEAKG